ncbi:MAG: hypothetical protein ABRQ38_18815 [Candidatus Eremiobacterota bacterium]
MSNTINTSTSNVQLHHNKENKKTQSKTEQKIDKTEKPQSKIDTPQENNKIDTKDKTSVSQDAKTDKDSGEEPGGIFTGLWNYATGKQDDSTSCLNQDKVKEFEDKLQKEDPERYKKYKESQSSADKSIKEIEDRAYLASIGVKYDNSGGPDQKKVKEFEDKLQKEDPERYKKYKESQDMSGQSISDSMEQSKETMTEGLKKADYYFNADHMLKYGITGVDQYKLDKENKEAEKTQMDLAKNKNVNSDHVKNILHSQEEINKSNLESADATQNIADTADTFTMGASGTFVEAGQEFKQGNYKEAALDGLEGLGRCALAAVLMAPEKVIGPACKAVSPAIGQMAKWGDDVLKGAGQVGDDLLKGAGKIGDDLVKGITETAEGIGKHFKDAKEMRQFEQNRKKVLEMLENMNKEGVLDKGKQIASEGIKEGKNFVSKGINKGKEVVSEGINYVKDGSWSTRESYEEFLKVERQIEQARKFFK